MKKAILWILAILSLALVIASFFMAGLIGEGGCDAMRICGYGLLLLFSILRTYWRMTPQQRRNISGSDGSDQE